VFLQPQFAEFGKQVVLFAHITNQIEGHPHDDLLVRKGRTGFPSFVFMDADGEMLALGGARTVEGFEKSLAEAQEMAALAAKAKAGDADADRTVFLKRLSWHGVPFEAAKARVAALKLDEAEAKQAASALLTLELNDARLTPDKKAGLAKLMKIHAEGRVPTDPRASAGYWRMVAMGAEREKDVAAYTKYVEYLRAASADEPRMKTQLDRAEAVLAAMAK
jgi:hypothetical protein